jgi:hypothetical protein
MSARKVQVFFYGSFMNLEVMKAAGLAKRPFAPATLLGFDLKINQRATLVDAGDGVVYGIIANFTHIELAKFYGDYGKTLTSDTYNPEPVIAHTRGGKWVAALTHISDDTEDGPPSPEYLDSMLTAAKNYGFPGWYRERIAAFGAV